MALKEFLKEKFSKDEDFKAAEKEFKIRKIIEERQKSSNERELERFFEEQRQAKIKMSLETIRKQKNRNALVGPIMDKTNIFKGHKSILTNGPSVFKKVKTKKSIFFK